MEDKFGYHQDIKNGDRAILVNDGRTAMQSDFNDTVIRKSLELHLISLLSVWTETDKHKENQGRGAGREVENELNVCGSSGRL